MRYWAHQHKLWHLIAFAILTLALCWGILVAHLQITPIAPHTAPHLSGNMLVSLVADQGITPNIGTGGPGVP
jgi:hypothetical protein